MTAASIRLLNWRDYLSPVCRSGFEKETGIRVDEVFVDSNDEFIARLADGEVVDVAIPTDWAVEALAGAGLLRPLDMGLLPNWRHVTHLHLREPPYDPGAGGEKYSSVYMFGTEGFAVRLDEVPVPHRTWEMLYDPAYAGRIVMVDGAREVLGPTLFLLGSDPNETDPGVLERATVKAVEQKPLVIAYDSSTESRSLLDRVVLMHCWDGDVAAAISQGAGPLLYVLPEEGFRVWADAPSIPASAPDPAAAHRFLDYLLIPEVAAQNANFTGYQPVVPAAEPLIRSLVQRSMRPTDEQIEAGTFLRDLGEVDAAYEECYRRIRGG